MAKKTPPTTIDPPDPTTDPLTDPRRVDDSTGDITPPSPVHRDPVRTVLLEVPVGQSNPDRYATRHLRDLSSDHARLLADIAQALIDEETKLKSGAPIRDNDDALAWILDRIHAG